MSEDCHDPEDSPWGPRGPWSDTKRIARATGDLDQDTGTKIVGTGVTKIKLGLAVLASRLLHKIKGTKKED